MNTESAFTRSGYSGVLSIWDAMLKMSSMKKHQTVIIDTVFVEMHAFNKQRPLIGKDRRQSDCQDHL